MWISGWFLQSSSAGYHRFKTNFKPRTEVDSVELVNYESFKALNSDTKHIRRFQTVCLRPSWRQTTIQVAGRAGAPKSIRYPSRSHHKIKRRISMGQASRSVFAIGSGEQRQHWRIKARLRVLPVRLQDLYSRIMSSTDTVYRAQALELFQIMRSSQRVSEQIGQEDQGEEPLTALLMSFALEKDPRLARHSTQAGSCTRRRHFSDMSKH